MNSPQPRCINLNEWMAGQRKIILQHGSRPYFLTITRRGKLILTAADEVDACSREALARSSSNKP